MSRIARVVIPDCPHHITQRGNRGEAVFFTPADRERYLALLAEYAAKHGLLIQAYCLMTNHVHLVAVPREAGSLGGALKPLHTRYTQHINGAQSVSGRLWQGRFYSCPLDRRHLLAAVRYVEMNPVRAGLVKRPEDFLWSSAAAHAGLRSDPVLSDPCNLKRKIRPADWLAWLGQDDDPQQEKQTATLRQCTHTGRPAGGNYFVAKLEATLGRILKPLAVGRPKKEKSKNNKKTK